MPGTLISLVAQIQNNIFNTFLPYLLSWYIISDQSITYRQEFSVNCKLINGLASAPVMKTKFDITVLLCITYQGKVIWMAKYICIHQGNGRDACGATKRKLIRCDHSSHHCYQHIQRTFPWLGWRCKVNLCLNLPSSTHVKYWISI